MALGVKVGGHKFLEILGMQQFLDLLTALKRLYLNGRYRIFTVCA
jgi:hypothetical protein